MRSSTKLKGRPGSGAKKFWPAVKRSQRPWMLLAHQMYRHHLHLVVPKLQSPCRPHPRPPSPQYPGSSQTSPPDASSSFSSSSYSPSSSLSSISTPSANRQLRRAKCGQRRSSGLAIRGSYRRLDSWQCGSTKTRLRPPRKDGGVRARPPGGMMGAFEGICLLKRKNAKSVCFGGRTSKEGFV